jgi:hypothetical protein
MPTGRTCQSPAMRTSAYCYYHARLQRRTHVPRKQLQLPALDSPSAIRNGVTQVLNHMLAGKIDPRGAGRALHGIQMASAQLENEHKFPRPLPKP